MVDSFEFKNSSGEKVDSSLREDIDEFSQMYHTVSEAEYSLLRPNSISVIDNNISMVPALGSEEGFVNTTMLSTSAPVAVEKVDNAATSVVAQEKQFDGNYEQAGEYSTGTSVGLTIVESSEIPYVNQASDIQYANSSNPTGLVEAADITNRTDLTDSSAISTQAHVLGANSAAISNSSHLQKAPSLPIDPSHFAIESNMWNTTAYGLSAAASNSVLVPLNYSSAISAAASQSPLLSGAWNAHVSNSLVTVPGEWNGFASNSLPVSATSVPVSQSSFVSSAWHGHALNSAPLPVYSANVHRKRTVRRKPVSYTHTTPIQNITFVEAPKKATRYSPKKHLSATIPAPVLMQAPLPAPILMQAPLPAPVLMQAPMRTPVLMRAPIPAQVLMRAPVPAPILMRPPMQAPVLMRAPVLAPVPVSAAVSVPVKPKKTRKLSTRHR